MAVVHDDSTDELDQGLGPGRLRITDTCVTLVVDGGNATTLVWRDGQTSWDADHGRIRFKVPHAGWLSLSDGDRMVLGGYDLADDNGMSPPVWVVLPAGGCSAGGGPQLVQGVTIRD